MKIRKFCACGVKLERDVSDEETAREVVTMFWTAHAGIEHGPVNERAYAKVIGRIIKRVRERKATPSEIEVFTMEGIDLASDKVQ